MNRFVVLLGLCVVAQTCLAGGQLPDAPHIYVEGEASIFVPPDSLTVTIAYEQVDPVLEVARSQVNDRSQSLLRALRDIGVSDQDISSTALGVSPAFDYRHDERKRIGTEVSRRVTVTLRDLTKYQEFVSAIIQSEAASTYMVKMGINTEAEVLGRAQVEALADARVRAERMAEAAGRHLGKVYSLTEFNLRENETYSLRPDRSVQSPDGDGRRMPALAMSTPRSREQLEPFSPGVVQATARVYVVFLLVN